MTTPNVEVIVIGAGLAGLACTLELQRSNVEVALLESTDSPGGRLRTAHQQGFLLDQGLHALHEGLPETRRWLDFSSLDLRPFHPGVLCRWGGGFRLLTDIWKQPQAFPQMLFSPIGSLVDKLHLAHYRRRLLALSPADLIAREEMTALDRLRLEGFSEAIIDRLFRQLGYSIFHEQGLDISSRAFEYQLLSCWSGNTSLPARGIESIPRQLVTRLRAETLRYHCSVESLGEGWVQAADDRKYECRALVVATDAREAARLLGQPLPPLCRGSICLHFAAPTPPLQDPVLVINSEGMGPISSLVCPSSLSSHYAPPDRALVQVHALNKGQHLDQLELLIRQQLGEWFGSDVALWRRLKVQSTGEGMPTQLPPVSDPGRRNHAVGDRIWVCGEFLGDSSIEGMLLSGRRAAEGLLRVLRG